MSISLNLAQTVADRPSINPHPQLLSLRVLFLAKTLDDSELNEDFLSRRMNQAGIHIF